MRENCADFKRVNQEEEPPLRTLDHGIAGEYVTVADNQPDPYPYVIRKDGKCYHGFR